MRVGSWVQCSPRVEHKKVDVYFFKTPDYPYSFCSMCLYRARVKNGTLEQAPRPNKINSWVKHSQSRPEKDTL